jgi:hypothetical protein
VNGYPDGIAAGPDGTVWFTEDNSNKIGRITLPLTAIGATPNPTEGVPFSGVVATFLDPDPAATPAEYGTTIVWGDGSITPGQLVRDATGGLAVMGVHTYARGGQSYPISVAILDPTGRTTIATTTARVAPAPLSAVAATIAAVEGAAVPAGTTLAAFTDTGGADPLAAYSATVAWGDGSTGTATVQQNGTDFRVVSAAAHTYAEEGTYTLVVTITEQNAGGVINTAYATGAAVISDAALTPVAVPALATQPKGTPLVAVTVASFNDGHPAAPLGDFTATIDWGDGSPTSIGTIVQPGGAGKAFTVTGNHTYVVNRTQPYTITVTIHDKGGGAITTTTTASVADVAPLVSGIPVEMTKGIAFTAPVAYILEPIGVPADPVGDYTATINWGDGTAATAGTIEAIPGGNWVVGSHTYSTSGPFTVTVTVKDDGGFTVTATATAFDPTGAAVPAAPLNNGGSTVITPSPVVDRPAVAVPAGPLHHGRRRADHVHHRVRPSTAGRGHIAPPIPKLRVADSPVHRAPRDRARALVKAPEKTWLTAGR